jgi:hypothetical protein
MLLVTESVSLYSECLTDEVLGWFGDFKIGEQIIRNLQYADDLVLLAKEETVLQGCVDRLTEIRRCYEMEMNVEKTTVMRISIEPSLVQMMTDKKRLESVECLNYLGSMTKMMQDLQLQLKPGLLWQKQHSTERRQFSKGNCIYI